MYTYFKMLEETAKCCKDYDSIRELTIDLAKSAGYHRGLHTFKNNNVRERTIYDKPFDDILTAKWLCFYKKLFFAKLSIHPEFTELHTQVINKTFYMVMSCLNIEKLYCDDIVNKYVNLALSSRIAEAMYLTKSKFSPTTYNKNNNRNFVFKGAIDNQAVSLNEIAENYGDGVYEDAQSSFNEDEHDEVIIDLKDRLKDNPYGEPLLDALMCCSRRINLSTIDKYIKLNVYEKTEKTKQYIADAYNVIKAYLIESTEMKKRVKKTSTKSIRFCEEEAG